VLLPFAVPVARAEMAMDDGEHPLLYDCSSASAVALAVNTPQAAAAYAHDGWMVTLERPNGIYALRIGYAFQRVFAAIFERHAGRCAGEAAHGVRYE